MAKTLKSKKISITTLDKVMKEIQVESAKVDWHSTEIIIKPTLSLKDMLAFVNGVATSCFADKTNAYLPEIKAFAIKCYTIEMYSNLSLPANNERKYDLIYNTDAFDVILKHIDIRQFNEIVDAINEKTENMAQANIEAIDKQLKEIYAAFDKLQEQLENIFSDVTSDDLLKLISAIGDGAIDEERLVNAYIKNKPGDKTIDETSGVNNYDKC